MAYIGKQPIVGNFQICDAISVVNGQAAYTMQVASTNVSPESASHMLVSLNGVLQKPGSSFTVSGATITFASNLATGDVIDFIILLGDALNSGTPSDGTVTTAKLAADAVTEAKIADDAVESEHLNNNIISGQTELASAPADTDEFLVSDAGTIKRIDYSLIKGGGMWEYISSATASNSSAIDFTTLSSDYRDFQVVISCLRPASDEQRIYGRVFTGTGGSQAIFTGEYRSVEIGRDNATLTDENTGDHIRISNTVGNDTSESASYEVIFYAPDQQGHKLVRSWGVHMGHDSGRPAVDNWGTSIDLESTDVTGIRIYLQSGNITSGKFSLYGRKHS